MSTDLADTTPVATVLAHVGLTPDALLGWGGESWVFALDNDRVLRIGRPGTTAEWAAGRTALVTELAAGAAHVPFALPEILSTDFVAGFYVTIERRLPGRSLLALLTEVDGATRATLLCNYLTAANQIGDIPIARPWFGELGQIDRPVRTPTFRAYLEERARRNMTGAGPAFATVDPAALAADLPEPRTPALVHLDAFPGNMLAEGDRITAVIDFGYSAVLGDRRLSPLVAAAYLDSEITPSATEEDRALTREWLANHDLLPLLHATRRWLAAYWSFASDDAELFAWCHKILTSENM